MVGEEWRNSISKSMNRGQKGTFGGRERAPKSELERVGDSWRDRDAFLIERPPIFERALS